METRSSGRELEVKFTCARCRKCVHIPYDDVMKGEHYGYLHNSLLPDRWYKLDTFHIMCDECTDKFKEFMEG